jgi:hypothetical protein
MKWNYPERDNRTIDEEGFEALHLWLIPNENHG